MGHLELLPRWSVLRRIRTVKLLPHSRAVVWKRKALPTEVYHRTCPEKTKERKLRERQNRSEGEIHGPTQRLQQAEPAYPTPCHADPSMLPGGLIHGSCSPGLGLRDIEDLLPVGQGRDDLKSLGQFPTAVFT